MNYYSIYFIFFAVTSIEALPLKDVGNLLGLPKISQMTEVFLNDIFDKNLPLIQGFIKNNKLEPLSLPDHIITVTDVGIGKVHLQRGWVQNLAEIKRTGNVTLRFNTEFVYFDFDLGWDNIYVNYDYTLRYLMLTRKGSLTLQFKNLRVRILGVLDLKTQLIKLEFLKFVDVDDFTLRLEGHLTDHLINDLTRLITVFAGSRVIREIEYQSTLIIEKKIKEINDAKFHFTDKIIHMIPNIISNLNIKLK